MAHRRMSLSVSTQSSRSCHMHRYQVPVGETRGREQEKCRHRSPCQPSPREQLTARCAMCVPVTHVPPSHTLLQIRAPCCCAGVSDLAVNCVIVHTQTCRRDWMASHARDARGCAATE